MHSARPTPTPTASRPRAATQPGIVANELYVFPIADALPFKAAASMLCVSLTVYSPLVRDGAGAGSGKKVAVISFGGLVRPLPYTAPHVLTALR
jgi:hypothetical protein